MGTCDFSVPILKNIKTKHQILSVFTKAPSKKGRGLECVKSKVHEFADLNNICVYTPDTLKTQYIFDTISDFAPDVCVVASYGLIIPKKILSIPRLGFLNVHPSKLPRYRGAAPIQRTIINGDNETAVCIMQMDSGIDTGDILMMESLLVPENVSFYELQKLLSSIGGRLILDVLENFDNIKAIKQSDDGIVYAHKLEKRDGEIHWRSNAFSIDCLVRGVTPWPGAYFYLDGKKINVLKIKYEIEQHDYEPGQIIGNEFDVACMDGVVRLLEIKPEGRGVMSGKSYMNGHKFINNRIDQ